MAEDKKISAEDRITMLEMQLEELSGRSGRLPKPKANPEFSYKEDHGVEHFVETPIDSNMQGVASGAKQLIPAKVILLPTKENPFHKQGEEFECDSRLAEEHIRRGFAKHVRTKEEHEKLVADQAKDKKIKAASKGK